MRNSDHILSQFLSDAKPRKVQVVRNRDSSVTSLDEEPAADAHSLSIRWRVPNDFKAVRNMQNNGVPIAMKDSPITQAILQMARAGLDLPQEPEKKRKRVLGLF